VTISSEVNAHERSMGVPDDKDADSGNPHIKANDLQIREKLINLRKECDISKRNQSNTKVATNGNQKDLLPGNGTKSRE
jgi:hypothetical protein